MEGNDLRFSIPWDCRSRERQYIGEEGVVWRLLGIQSLYGALGGNAWANLLVTWKCEAIYYPQSTSPTSLPLHTHKESFFIFYQAQLLINAARYMLLGANANVLVSRYYAMSTLLDWVCEVLAYCRFKCLSLFCQSHDPVCPRMPGSDEQMGCLHSLTMPLNSLIGRGHHSILLQWAPVLTHYTVAQYGCASCY